MVDRPYRDYSVEALLDLRGDLQASKAQIEEQRADYLNRGGSAIDDLGQLRKILNTHTKHLTAIDQELEARRRAGAARHEERAYG